MVKKIEFWGYGVVLYNYMNKDILNGEENYILYNKWIFFFSWMGFFCLFFFKWVVCVIDVKSKVLCKEGFGIGCGKGRVFFFVFFVIRKSVFFYVCNVGYIWELGF